MQLYKIASGKRLFDARIELDDSAVILHSRGGATGARPPGSSRWRGGARDGLEGKDVAECGEQAFAEQPGLTAPVADDG